MPPTPLFGDPLAPCHPSQAALDLLALRRSATAAQLQEPGPDLAALRAILTIGARVPDHRRIMPCRFIVFAGAARAKIDAKLGEIFARQNADADEGTLNIEASRFQTVPVTIAVVSKVEKNHKTPEWEQVMTAGAACQNILLAANAMGFAGQWVSEWIAYDEAAKKALGLEAGENIAGLILLGSVEGMLKERPRKSASEITHFYEG